MVKRRLLEIECQLSESRIVHVSASTAFIAELVEEARRSGKTVHRDGNCFSFGPYVGDLRASRHPVARKDFHHRTAMTARSNFRMRKGVKGDKQ
jgi:hypothetical protein